MTGAGRMSARRHDACPFRVPPTADLMALNGHSANAMTPEDEGLPTGARALHRRPRDLQAGRSVSGLLEIVQPRHKEEPEGYSPVDAATR